MPGVVPSPCPIYRILHFENLADIVKEGGLWCGNQMAARGIPYKQIGLQGLTKNRAGRTVPVGPGGNLNDYVPFYFCPRSIMLYQIHTGQVPNYQGGQEPVIYLVTTVEEIIKFNLSFAFTDRHAKTNYAEFYDSHSALGRIDWPTIQSTSFARTDADPDRPTRKQAEFLVHQFVPLSAVLGIGVYSQKWKDDVDKLFGQAGVKMKVKVHPAWYFR